ncbi:MAG: hypothetical protein PWQ37_1476 [Candidatus Petromonas sp.]|jgi:hypothetical protein|nr:hypothetical protein [Candidatus Petromonas sp.]
MRKDSFYPMPMCPMMVGTMSKPIQMPMMPNDAGQSGQYTDAPVVAPVTPPTTMIPPDFEIEPGAPVQQDISYTQGYLKTKIGKYIKVEFLIGTNMLIDREGVLLEVGISYIVIREAGTNDELMCDIYSIKFVRIFKDQDEERPSRR